MQWGQLLPTMESCWEVEFAPFAPPNCAQTHHGPTAARTWALPLPCYATLGLSLPPLPLVCPLCSSPPRTGQCMP